MVFCYPWMVLIQAPASSNSPLKQNAYTLHSAGSFTILLGRGLHIFGEGRQLPLMS